MVVFQIMIGAILGGFITILVSRHYFKRASEELTREVGSLHKNTILILRGLKENGIIDYTEDEYGNPKGLIVTMKLSIGGKVSTSATANKKSVKKQIKNES